MPEVTIRPMTHDDVDAAVRIQYAAFGDLDRRNGEPVHPPTEVQLERAKSRDRHFIDHDPDGAWVAVTGGGDVVGCGLALRRDNLWGLSLLVVDPAAQSSGAGRQLLDATLEYAAGCDLGVIESSDDARAMRAYATSGFSLFPQICAAGKPALDAAPASMARAREGGAADLEFADEVDRAVRRAPRGPDHAWIAGFAPMYVIDDADGRGYAYLRDGDVFLLAATNDATAADLLWRCLRHSADNELSSTVDNITGEQQWAVAACLAARLDLKPSGPVFWRGATPPRAYLPSGAFL